VRAPHKACPHPNLVPVNPRMARGTQSSRVSGATSTECVWPFTVVEIGSMDLVTPVKCEKHCTFDATQMQFGNRHERPSAVSELTCPLLCR
jgi:hypothetical protein